MFFSDSKTVKQKWATTWQNQQNECAPSEDSDQLGHPPSLIRVFAVRLKNAWVLSYPLSAQRRLWSDWADAQADLSFCWMHTHFVGFVMSRLKYIYFFFYFITTVDTMTLTSHLFDVKNAKTTLLLNVKSGVSRFENCQLSTGQPCRNNFYFITFRLIVLCI